MNRICPACNSRSVIRALGARPFGNPTHSCKACGIRLLSQLTVRTLVVTALGLVGLVVVALANVWLQTIFEVPKPFAIVIAAASLVATYSFAAKFALRSLAYRAWA